MGAEKRSSFAARATGLCDRSERRLITAGRSPQGAVTEASRFRLLRPDPYNVVGRWVKEAEDTRCADWDTGWERLKQCIKNAWFGSTALQAPYV